MTELPSQPASPDQPVVGERRLILTVYILYLVGFLTGVTALIGVIIAHVKVSSSSDIARTHFSFQIQTFWLGVLYIIVGWLLMLIHPIFGLPLLIWWAIWTVVRTIKGILLLNEHKPIAHPKSLLFG